MNRKDWAYLLWQLVKIGFYFSLLVYWGNTLNEYYKAIPSGYRHEKMPLDTWYPPALLCGIFAMVKSEIWHNRYAISILIPNKHHADYAKYISEIYLSIYKFMAWSSLYRLLGIHEWIGPALTFLTAFGYVGFLAGKLFFTWGKDQNAQKI